MWPIRPKPWRVTLQASWWWLLGGKGRGGWVKETDRPLGVDYAQLHAPLFFSTTDNLSLLPRINVQTGRSGGSSRCEQHDNQHEKHTSQFQRPIKALDANNSISVKWRRLVWQNAPAKKEETVGCGSNLRDSSVPFMMTQRDSFSSSDRIDRPEVSRWMCNIREITRLPTPHLCQ